MKKNFFASLIAVSAALTIVLSGCSGKSIDQIKGNNVLETQITETSSPLITTSATTTVSTITNTIPIITSGSTCTTIESDSSIIDELLSKMTLDEKIYQMFIVTPEALTNFSGSVTQAGSLTKSSIESTPVGGLIYFSQNIESWQQTYEMIHLSQEYAQESNNDIGLFFAVDEEGGSVARVSKKLNTYSCYDMEYYGNKLDYDEVYNVGNTIGTALSDLGFNVNFAPVADVNISPSNELGSRIFSSDAQVVADMAANFVKGVEDTGVSATLKHFPGLGAGTGNTHKGSVVIDRSYSDLANTEFLAFKGGINAGADFVMVGHQITTASEDNLPGDLSPVVISWLKKDLGYNGLIVTDSQSMGAITENYTSGEAAVLSLKAGVDIILMPYDLHNAASGVRDAVNSGDISEERINESVRKILTKKLNLGLLDIELPTETTTVDQ
ncbi:MAG: glycoside hydrolase family 3 N-terminal domain-containing protein [Oscillospiraceae bacterium]|nr:glycoside hydrolase family 3 N-terminal domain-containing protein [Oscillospiraceae bacterium]